MGVYVESVESKAISFVCISLNNGPIFNPIEILELS